MENQSDVFDQKVLKTLETLESQGRIRKETSENGEDAWYLNE